MPNLKLDPKLLAGATIKRVGTIKAERRRNADEYILLQCVDSAGNPFRLMFTYAAVSRPCPNDKLMLGDLISGTEFFTLEEIQARRDDKPLGKSSTDEKPYRHYEELQPPGDDPSTPD